MFLGIYGQDSTLTGKFCQMAIEEMREETGDNFANLSLFVFLMVFADARTRRCNCFQKA